MGGRSHNKPIDFTLTSLLTRRGGRSLRRSRISSSRARGGGRRSAAKAMAAQAAAAPTSSKYQPSDFLKAVLGRPVVVKLNSGVAYKGVLACLDGYMNIAMEQTEEYVDGQLKAKYGDCFIRGNNVHYISTARR